MADTREILERPCMSFTFSYAEAFDRRSLEDIPKDDRRRIQRAMEEKLMTLPQVFGKPLRRSLRGYWSLRVGKYRVLYRIEKQHVYIFDIGYRSKIYARFAST